MSKEESKIISWLYMVEISGDNQVAENLKRGLPISLQEMARQSGLENLARTYAEAQQQNLIQKVDWE